MKTFSPQGKTMGEREGESRKTAHYSDDRGFLLQGRWARTECTQHAFNQLVQGQSYGPPEANNSEPTATWGLAQHHPHQHYY